MGTSSLRVFVAGGAGYIGSHTVVQLVKAGHVPIIADNFSNSKPSVIERINALTGTEVEVHRVDLTDQEATDKAFAQARPDAVIHFAGMKAVGESVKKPLEYYANNLGSTICLLQAMRAHGCELMIFSSSATVYGNAPVPCDETVEHLSSNSPYGWTKVMGEQILSDVAAASDIRVALLRYFNPVGAHPSGTMGEDPQGIPNNLMPYIAQVATGRRDELTIFGDDYPTPDGTCQRDYLHVMDLADGHVAALEKLAEGDVKVRAWNLGTGSATSVLELTNAFAEAAGKPVPYKIGPRRPGDRPQLWADPARAKEELGWEAKLSIADMCADTWRWQSANPQGYPEE